MLNQLIRHKCLSSSLPFPGWEAASSVAWEGAEPSPPGGGMPVHPCSGCAGTFRP